MRSSLDRYEYLMKEACEIGARTGYFLHSDWAFQFLAKAVAATNLPPDFLVGHSGHGDLPVLLLGEGKTWRHRLDHLLIPVEEGSNGVDSHVKAIREAGCDMPVCEILPTTNQTGKDLIVPFLGIPFFVSPKTHLPNHYANGCFIDFLNVVTP